MDSIPPTYTGPDTIFVQCVADLPGPGDLTDVLAPYFVDNCYNIICVSESVSTNGTNSVTFCVNFKDWCVNWADKFFVTFVAIGGCKPICTETQSNWGNTGGTINGLITKDVIEQLIAKNGAVTAGKLGKTITVTSAECLQSMLPGNGHTNQFSPPGKHVFSAENECQPSSVLLNADGTLKNKLAANVLAMQLNIWYNLDFNQRDLRVQLISSLPACLVDPLVVSKMQVDMLNVQGLVNLSNDYLAGVGFFPQNFGTPLNSAVENVSNYWKNCQINDPCSSTVTVSGSLKTENLDGFEAGKVQLDGSGSAGPLNMTSFADINGHFEFSNALPLLSNYTLTPSPVNMDYLNGVTTYDLVLISKHILGVEPFNSPYKMIAADANKSGSITTFDIVEFRKLILGIYDELPNTTPWRFVDKSFAFPVPENPFASAFPERIVVENIQASRMTEDFVSVKIGDVNGSAHANGLMQSEERNSSTLLFDVDDRFVPLGEILEITFTADQTVQGYQLTLNTAGLEVLEIVGKGLSADNFAVYPLDAALAMSWNLPEGTAAFAATFTLKVRATQSGQLSSMLSLSNRITRSEAYLNKEAGSNHPLALDVALRFHQANGIEISGSAFELYQNVPNPFVDKTTIGFYLPEATQATLSIFDQTGRLIYTAKGDFDKGANVFELDQSLINNTGSMLYKVATATDMAVKKMMQTK